MFVTCCALAADPHPIVGAWILERTEDLPAEVKSSEYRVTFKASGFLIMAVSTVEYRREPPDLERTISRGNVQIQQNGDC
jgi:hypothetical protein